MNVWPKLLFIFILLLGVTFANDYVIRTEACYVVDPPNTWSQWEDNLYVSSLLDYELLTIDKYGFSIYATPRVMYSYSEGFNLDLTVRASVPLVGASNTQTLLQGAKFPTNFLNDCNVYVRYNIFGQ